MEIRYFQIIVPFLSFLFIWAQYRAYRKNVLSISETVIISLFWLCIAFLAVFPDMISDSIAHVFGIEDNINAIVFFALGLLFYFQLQLYKIIKRQDQLLTELTRKIALDKQKNK